MPQINEFMKGQTGFKPIIVIILAIQYLHQEPLPQEIFMNQKPYILYLKNGHQAFLEQLCHRLTQSGYNIIGTYYDERTLELIRQQKPDVLILDLTKQDCENWRLFRQIKTDKSLAGISIIDVSNRVAEKGRIVLDDQIQPDLERVARSIEILARKSQPVDSIHGA